MHKIDRINYNISRKNRSNLPILCVRFSGKHIRAQLFHNGKIVCEVSSLNCKDIFNDKVKPYNMSGASALGKLCGERIWSFVSKIETEYMNDIKNNKSIKNKEKRELKQYYVLNRGDREYGGSVKVFNEAVLIGLKSHRDQHDHQEK
jgi:ribosomal protein L18